jgi:tRNA pseudouridine38-40 synthase
MTTKLTIEYDGTSFSGWASQPGKRTVQAELERVLEVLLRQPASLTVAGRTDRGVHALAQVASYDGPIARIEGMNALLPDDVAVIAAEPAPEGFSARHDATSRAYTYRVMARRARTALLSKRVTHWNYPADFASLEACAALLPGNHDFTAFTPVDTYHVRFDRDVYTARWEDHGHGNLQFWIEADSFMRNMNRILVGTMLEVARGTRSLEDFARLLDGQPRVAAGMTAPSHGLYLAGVGYRGERVLNAAR